MTNAEQRDIERLRTALSELAKAADSYVELVRLVTKARRVLKQTERTDGTERR